MIRLPAIHFPFNPWHWSVGYLSAFFLLIWWQQGQLIFTVQNCGGDLPDCFTRQDALHATTDSSVSTATVFNWSTVTYAVLGMLTLWILVFGGRAGWLYYRLHRQHQDEYRVSAAEYEIRVSAWKKLLYKQCIWLGIGILTNLVHGAMIGFAIHGWPAWSVATTDLVLMVAILNHRAGQSTRPDYPMIMEKYTSRLLVLTGLVLLLLIGWLILQQFALVSFAVCMQPLQCYASYQLLFDSEPWYQPRQISLLYLLFAIQLLVWVLAIVVRYQLIPKLISTRQRAIAWPLYWLQIGIPLMWLVQAGIGYTHTLIIAMALPLCGSWVLGVWIRFAKAQPLDSLELRIQTSAHFRSWVNKQMRQIR